MKERSQTIETFINNSYTTEFREMCYELLKEHVGLRHIGPVITSVLRFANRKVTNLPSETSLRTMNKERLALAQRQLAEQFIEKKHTTLYSDETSKKTEKYMGFHASDKEKNMYVLGIRDMATKSATDTLETFKEVLIDINEIKVKETASDVGKIILSNIANTMSDRASTEEKWHNLLEEYRKEILPEVQENWHLLSDEEKRPMEKLQNFYRGLHSYVQAAEVTASALKELEKSEEMKTAATNNDESDEDVEKGEDPRIITKSEPGIIRLIRTASNAFVKGADEKSGAAGDFSNFGPLEQKLKDNEMSSLPLEGFRGNRFNIIFFNGGFVYFLHKEMTDFLKAKPDKNRLLRAVLKDLNLKSNKAGCKILGLISKQLMGPLWRVIENDDVHFYNNWLGKLWLIFEGDF